MPVPDVETVTFEQFLAALCELRGGDKAQYLKSLRADFKGNHELDIAELERAERQREWENSVSNVLAIKETRKQAVQDEVGFGGEVEDGAESVDSFELNVPKEASEPGEADITEERQRALNHTISQFLQADFERVKADPQARRALLKQVIVWDLLDFGSLEVERSELDFGGETGSALKLLSMQVMRLMISHLMVTPDPGGRVASKRSLSDVQILFEGHWDRYLRMHEGRKPTLKAFFLSRFHLVPNFDVDSFNDHFRQLGLENFALLLNLIAITSVDERDVLQVQLQSAASTLMPELMERLPAEEAIELVSALVSQVTPSEVKEANSFVLLRLAAYCSLFRDGELSKDHLKNMSKAGKLDTLAELLRTHIEACVQLAPLKHRLDDTGQSVLQYELPEMINLRNMAEEGLQALSCLLKNPEIYPGTIQQVLTGISNKSIKAGDLRQLESACQKIKNIACGEEKGAGVSPSRDVTFSMPEEQVLLAWFETLCLKVLTVLRTCVFSTELKNPDASQGNFQFTTRGKLDFRHFNAMLESFLTLMMKKREVDSLYEYEAWELLKQYLHPDEDNANGVTLQTLSFESFGTFPELIRGLVVFEQTFPTYASGVFDRDTLAKAITLVAKHCLQRVSCDPAQVLQGRQRYLAWLNPNLGKGSAASLSAEIVRLEKRLPAEVLTIFQRFSSEFQSTSGTLNAAVSKCFMPTVGGREAPVDLPPEFNALVDAFSEVLQPRGGSSFFPCFSQQDDREYRTVKMWWSALRLALVESLEEGYDVTSWFSLLIKGVIHDHFSTSTARASGFKVETIDAFLKCVISHLNLKYKTDVNFNQAKRDELNGYRKLYIGKLTEDSKAAVEAMSSAVQGPSTFSTRRARKSGHGDGGDIEMTPTKQA
jgi:hypothetical protein